MAYPEHPLPLLTLICTEDGTSKWKIPDEARSVLESIEESITAVSIVGKYRGGKSYLMNVIGGRPGFVVGDTIQVQTKGIWMLPVKHPKEEGRCLLLLDTEGLHDAAFGDSNHDMQLFVFALLMSSCLIYNIMGALDQTFISELQIDESMKRQERHRALNNAWKTFLEGMQMSLEGKLPMETTDLGNLATKHKEQAVEVYRRIVRNEEEAVELNEMIEAKYQEFSADNHDVSHKVSKAALSKCFKIVEENLEHTALYYNTGGHDLFKSHLKDAEAKFSAMTGLGPAKCQVLTEKLENISATEVAIVSCDKAMGKKELEVAELKRELQARETERIKQQSEQASEALRKTDKKLDKQEQRLQAQVAETNIRQKELEKRILEMEINQLEQQRLFQRYQNDQEEKAKRDSEKIQEQLQSLMGEMRNMKRALETQKMHMSLEAEW